MRPCNHDNDHDFAQALYDFYLDMYDTEENAVVNLLDSFSPAYLDKFYRFSTDFWARVRDSLPVFYKKEEANEYAIEINDLIFTLEEVES